MRIHPSLRIQLHPILGPRLVAASALDDWRGSAASRSDDPLVRRVADDIMAAMRVADRAAPRYQVKGPPLKFTCSARRCFATSPAELATFCRHGGAQEIV